MVNKIGSLSRCLAGVMVLIVVMCAALCFTEAVYADGETSGKCGDHATWSYADGTLTIAGFGEMDDSPWDDFTEDIKNIVISDGITGISGYAFEGCTQLTSVTLPSQLETIGTGAFANTGLTSIFIPQTVTYIGDNPFRDCPDLASIQVDTDNYNYSDRWFDDGECNAILAIDRDWEDNIIDKSVDLIAGCKNTKVPRDVHNIMPYAFSGCTGLKSVTFRSITPDDTERPGLTYIGEHAFDGCVSLEGLFIPYTVSNIGEAAFSGCGGLKKIEVAASNQYFYSSNNALIQKNGRYYDYVDDEVEQKYGPVLILGCSDTVIPSGVKAIGEGAFSKCQDLTSITIPENIVEIGQDAFRECPKLTEVNFPETGHSRILHYAFRDCTALTTVNMTDSVKQILSGVFMGCTSLKSITVPGTDLQFAESLFRDCTALESITFESGVTELGERTFWGCTALKYIVVPVSLTEDLGWSMFSECVSMTDMYYEGTREQFLECDYISLDGDDTFTTIYSNPPHKVKVHFNSTGPEDVPHEHSYSTDWKSDATSHWHECSCGDKKDTADHTFKWITDKAATATLPGVKHEECTVCGYKRNEGTVIDPTGGDEPNPAPKLGRTKITSAKAGKKQAVIKYKALKGGVKYQIAYRISGSWKYKTTTKTSLTIKKLKSKKKYTFKVRAFKKVSGKNYYGAWSAAKKVKIK